MLVYLVIVTELERLIISIYKSKGGNWMFKLIDYSIVIYLPEKLSIFIAHLILKPHHMAISDEHW
jgi:hypothetical protein